jgi:hypothetical protein
MQEANVRIDTLDDLAVQFQYEPQNTMGRRMLRAKIDRKIA